MLLLLLLGLSLLTGLLLGGALLLLLLLLLLRVGLGIGGLIGCIVLLPRGVVVLSMTDEI